LDLARVAAAPQGEVQVHRLNRWAFSGAGPSEEQIAYRNCSAGRLITVNRHHTGGDWLTMIVTAGWYTPEHVTLQCAWR
jgi:hypothetical protein